MTDAVNPLEMGKFIVLIGGLITFWLKFEKFRKEFTGQGEKMVISPQPLEIKMQQNFATKEDMKAVWKEFTKINNDLLEMRRSAETRGENIFRRINDISAATDRKIDDIPMKVIDILNKTGALEK
jgi:hypothetical protein